MRKPEIPLAQRFDHSSLPMPTLSRLYGHSLALLTDLYQLTMAAGYWKVGMAEREAVFSLFYRRPPFGGSYTIASGLNNVIDLLDHFYFTNDDLAYLAEVPGSDGKPIFSAEFLDYLRRLKLRVDVDAMPEGTVSFPHEPLVRVRGPLLQCQLLETALLTLINFPTLIATKASRVKRAAGDGVVLEFGLRRAQGIDGGITASRAAMIGGCQATSNVLAGKLFDIPIKGTHAHSWVMSFDSEALAFDRYAEAMPNNSVFLVDTYDTLGGVANAIEAGKKLRQQGHTMSGIRLDSGDLVELSIAARSMLDEAGFHDTKIVASNDLDEYAIVEHKQRGGKIDIYGVGTRLATAYEEPALGGVYKLGAIRNEAGQWQAKLKLSEQMIKVSNPGQQLVRRYHSSEGYLADMIYEETLGASSAMVNLAGVAQHDLSHADGFEELLMPVMRGGKVVAEFDSVAVAAERARMQLDRFPADVLALKDPVPYRVGLEHGLHDMKQDLIAKLRES